MKWKIFQKAKSSKKRAGSGSKKGASATKSRVKRRPRRSKETPFWVKPLLKGVGVLSCIALVIFGLWYAFDAYYFKSTDLFVVKDAQKNVIIDTGKTLTPDLIKQILGIKDGINLFSIPIDEKRVQLMEKAPSIKDIAIVRYMPDKLKISIIERDPIARVEIDGRVVDDEGVVFVRYTRTSGLPIILGSKKIKSAKPGDRLTGMEMAAVRRANSTFRPECKSRFMSVDSSHSRYLLLKFPDSRRSKIAWAGMKEKSAKSKRLMIKQYDNLINAMSNDIGMEFKMFDAQHPGRIFGKSSNF
jgi:hypothetical protein